MKSNIFSNIQNQYTKGNGFTKLLYINLAFFIIYIIIHVPLSDSSKYLIDSFINNYLLFPINIKDLLNRPWSILSYMFLHHHPFHLFFNMIWLYFGSKIFLQFFNNRQLITTYIFGGIIGAICFSLFHKYFDITEPLIGASAGVVAVIIAVAAYQPNYNISVLFLSNIKLKHIAWLSVFLFYINLDGKNPGGNIAHLGGALYGYLYVVLLKQGFDLSINFDRIAKNISLLFKTNKKLKKTHKRSEKSNDDTFRKCKANQQKEIDLILEKISKSGYESLTQKEKERLFKESKK